MSEFITNLPLPIEDLLKLLPPGSALHPRDSVKLSADKTEVQVTWYNEDIKTNANRPVDYPLASLRGDAEQPDEILAECRKVQTPKVATGKGSKAKQGQ